MNVVVVVPPPVEPVTDELVFSHLRLDVAAGEPLQAHPDYEMVMSQVRAAREKAEEITRRSFVQQTLRLVHFTMPPGAGWIGWSRYRQAFDLLRPPIISVLAVQYFDEANVLRTVDPASYFVTDDLVPRLRFTDDFAVPCTYGRDDAVRIDYVAGYAPTTAEPVDYRANVPDGIKQAILLGTQLLYDELTPDKRTALENARDALLESKRVHSF